MKSLETSLRILSAFCGERSTWSVTELASALCLEKPLVSKNLSCFRAAGFLQHDALTRTYSAGIRSFLLGAQFLNNNPLVREAGAELRRLAERTRQTSTLCTLDFYIDTERTGSIKTDTRGAVMQTRVYQIPAGLSLAVRQSSGTRVLVGIVT